MFLRDHRSFNPVTSRLNTYFSQAMYTTSTVLNDDNLTDSSVVESVIFCYHFCEDLWLYCLFLSGWCMEISISKGNGAGNILLCVAEGHGIVILTRGPLNSYDRRGGRTNKIIYRNGKNGKKKLIFVMKLINNSNRCLPENVVEMKIKLMIIYNYVKSVSAIKVCLSLYP